MAITKISDAETEKTKPAAKATAPVEGIETPEVVEPTSVFLKLSKVSTYTHPDGTMFNSGVIYSVSVAKAKELLLERSYGGVPYFLKVEDPDSVAVKNVKIAQTLEEPTASESAVELGEDGMTITHAEPQTPTAVEDSQADLDADLIDTGLVGLSDANGNDVGVTI